MTVADLLVGALSSNAAWGGLGAVLGAIVTGFFAVMQQLYRRGAEVTAAREQRIAERHQDVAGKILDLADRLARSPFEASTRDARSALHSHCIDLDVVLGTDLAGRSRALCDAIESRALASQAVDSALEWRMASFARDVRELCWWLTVEPTPGYWRKAVLRARVSDKARGEWLRECVLGASRPRPALPAP